MNFKYTHLGNAYNELEKKVEEALRYEVTKSKMESAHVDTTALEVNIYNYVELAIIDDTLTFIDNGGYHYNLYNECDLEDLIDILTKL